MAPHFTLRPRGVEVVDIATAMVTASITVGIDPESMQVDALGQKAYAVNYGSDNVSVIDIATNTVEATIAVGGSPLAIGDFLLEELLIPGDLCTTASDINSLFGGQTDVPQTSGLYNNNDATTDAFDPDFGWECFGEPSGGGENPELNRTLWFSFTGDGNTYSITTVECNSSDYIDSGDTQMALYSGSDCNNLSAEDCNDDFDSDNVLFQAYLELTTEMGVEYFLMIDGFGGSFPADGEFCIEVTQLPESSTKDLPQSKIRLFPNPTTGLLYLDQLDVERIEVYNEQSQLVFAQNQSTQQIDVSHLPAGMYFVKGIGAARIYTGRVVKE
jgi:YVTN family beta-propeller protein